MTLLRARELLLMDERAEIQVLASDSGLRELAGHILALTQDVVRLRGALQAYGRHQASCPQNRENPPEGTPPCRCGFEKWIDG